MKRFPHSFSTKGKTDQVSLLRMELFKYQSPKTAKNKKAAGTKVTMLFNAASACSGCSTLSPVAEL
jgi:hypothetical protein